MCLVSLWPKTSTYLCSNYMRLEGDEREGRVSIAGRRVSQPWELRTPSPAVYLVTHWSSLHMTATVREPSWACVEPPVCPGWRKELTLLRESTWEIWEEPGAFPLIVFSFCLQVPPMQAWLAILIKTVGRLRDIYLSIWLLYGCRNGLLSRDTWITNPRQLESCESPKNKTVRSWGLREPHVHPPSP